ncbi:MAG: hypothetical protein ACHQF3_05075 [Alphaproteobacteria bacterium]
MAALDAEPLGALQASEIEQRAGAEQASALDRRPISLVGQMVDVTRAKLRSHAPA